MKVQSTHVLKAGLRILAAVCLLWAVLPLVRGVLPGSPPVWDFWSGKAIEDAEQILARSGQPNFLDGEPLSVSRKTLILLKEEAKSKQFAPYQRDADIMFRISAGFALLAGVSLLVLTQSKPCVTRAS